VVEELSTLGFIENEMMKISARSGENVPQVLDRIIKE
jgi:translation elongation factor EF-4